MNWDQIEKNWAAMARRVRPDRPTTEACDAVRQPVCRNVRTAADDTLLSKLQTTPSTHRTV